MSHSKHSIDDQVLKNFFLFAGLDNTQLNRIKQTMQYRQLQEGEFLFEHGQKAERFFILLNGHIKLIRLSLEGMEKVIEIVRPGESFAEAIMFMEKQIYPVTSQAIIPSEVISFENKVFLGILAESFDTCKRVMCDMSMRLRTWLGEIDNLTLQNATYRLVNYLLYQIPEDSKNSCQVSFQIPKHVIASRLSIKPETLSRILQHLSKEGLITVEGKIIHIHNLDRLKLYSQN
jgi:CRP/FNR family transcriptional regulator, dissimilatory nitrate respiration regulator